MPAAIVLAALAPIALPVEGQGDTFRFWYAGQLALQGRLYDPAAWAEAPRLYGPAAANVAENCIDVLAATCVFQYLPGTAWLFAPLALLPPSIGTLLIDVLVVVTAVAGVIAAVLAFGPADPGRRALLLAAVFVSHPFVVDIRAGHFVGLLLLGVVLLARGLRRSEPSSVAAAAVTFGLKPHLFGALAPLVLARLARERRWGTVALTSVAVAMSVGVPLALTPGAIPAVTERLGGLTALAWASPYALAALLVPAAPALAFAVIAIVSAAALAIALRAAPVERATDVLIAGGCALSLVATPYAQPYDLLLLVPALALVVKRAPVAPYLIAAPLVYAAVTWLALIVGGPVARLDGLLPVALLIALAAPLAARPPTLL